jgi:hypothetical protein
MPETTKIVINACYGGFSISNAAMKRYAELMGFEYKAPVKEYYTSYVIDLAGTEISDYEINRTDPVLVQVVEELGDEANGMCSLLRIVELEKGTLYRIEEYDGFEHIETKADIEWKIA